VSEEIRGELALAATLTRAHDFSALEFQNAESKRVYEASGSRHLQFSTQGTTHRRRVLTAQ
jgi:hypothetical protein